MNVGFSGLCIENESYFEMVLWSRKWLKMIMVHIDLCIPMERQMYPWLSDQDSK